MFEHFILTRFDYPADYPHLQQRIELFQRYTLPSIERQSCQNFTWIIRTKSPEVASLITHLPNAKTQSDFQVRPQSAWVITTRLDNDDAVSPLFIEQIQQRFQERELVIDSKGYRIDHERNSCGKFDYYDKVRCSPFASLIEQSTGIRGIYHVMHGELGKHHDVEIIADHLWAQVIHKTNKLMRWGKQIKGTSPPAWITQLKSIDVNHPLRYADKRPEQNRILEIKYGN